VVAKEAGAEDLIVDTEGQRVPLFRPLRAR
jgi:hypothetical protein